MPSPIIMLLLLLLSLPVSAHELHADGGFWDGFNHPVLGFDHLLAMLSVGILSTQLGRSAIWSVPLAFLFFMTLGAVAGMSLMPLPFVESGIALSVLLLGLAIALNREMPISFAMAFVASLPCFTVMLTALKCLSWPGQAFMPWAFCWERRPFMLPG